ncbi:MAG: hypothetical protein BV459_07615 [Thermoplasmata archaeon M11B2D]|nr:MAG: hypothetical protein BV459_07615 [Thermoplasmata archaeon M11B2D]
MNRANVVIGVDTMLEVKLNDAENFLKIKETLTRIGIASEKTKILYQSCHILHKRGRYFIVHFKELFALDGKPVDFSENDIARRNKIAALLEEWGLVEIVNKQAFQSPMATVSQIKILP